MSGEHWQVAYAGFRFDPRTGDRLHLYYKLDDTLHHAAAGRQLMMKKELLPASPGAVLEIDVEVEDESVSVHTKDRRYAEFHWRDRDPELIGVWSAEDKANSALALAARGALKDGFKAALDPIRSAYALMGGAQRAQLIAQVVRYVAGGG